MPPDRIQLSQEILLDAIGDQWSEEHVQAAIELLTGSEGKFPPGVRRLPAPLVRAVQRERLIVAMLRAAAELGYGETNVQEVIERAGVSRPTFYEHFMNKEDCFLAAFDTSAKRLRNRVHAAADRGGANWRDRLRLGLGELVSFVVSEPETARTLIVEARGASAAAVVRRVELLDHFSTCLDERARELLPVSEQQSALTASGVVGGVEALLYSRLCRNQYTKLRTLLPAMMYFAVLPYEGHEAASEELGLRAV